MIHGQKKSTNSRDRPGCGRSGNQNSPPPHVEASDPLAKPNLFVTKIDVFSARTLIEVYIDDRKPGWSGQLLSAAAITAIPVNGGAPTLYEA
jgi:hypothetical protein